MFHVEQAHKEGKDNYYGQYISWKEYSSWSAACVWVGMWVCVIVLYFYNYSILCVKLKIKRKVLSS